MVTVQVQELARELAGAPDEQRLTMAGMDTAEAIRARHRMQARDEVEEELMVSDLGSLFLFLRC